MLKFVGEWEELKKFGFEFKAGFAGERYDRYERGFIFNKRGTSAILQIFTCDRSLQLLIEWKNCPEYRKIEKCEDYFNDIAGLVVKVEE